MKYLFAYALFVEFLRAFFALFPHWIQAQLLTNKKSDTRDDASETPFLSFIIDNIVHARTYCARNTLFKLVVQNNVFIQNREQMDDKKIRNRKHAGLSVHSEGDVDSVAAALRDQYNICEFSLLLLH